jgi:hypothetical protein
MACYSYAQLREISPATSRVLMSFNSVDTNGQKHFIIMALEKKLTSSETSINIKNFEVFQICYFTSCVYVRGIFLFKLCLKNVL